MKLREKVIIIVKCTQKILTYMKKQTFFAKPAIQNPNIQPQVLLAKMKGQQSMYYFIYCHLLGYFVWFAVSK